MLKLSSRAPSMSTHGRRLRSRRIPQGNACFRLSFFFYAAVVAFVSTVVAALLAGVAVVVAALTSKTANIPLQVSFSLSLSLSFSGLTFCRPEHF